MLNMLRARHYRCQRQIDVTSATDVQELVWDCRNTLEVQSVSFEIVMTTQISGLWDAAHGMRMRDTSHVEDMCYSGRNGCSTCSSVLAHQYLLIVATEQDGRGDW